MSKLLLVKDNYRKMFLYVTLGLTNHWGGAQNDVVAVLRDFFRVVRSRPRAQIRRSMLREISVTKLICAVFIQKKLTFDFSVFWREL